MRAVFYTAVFLLLSTICLGQPHKQKAVVYNQKKIEEKFLVDLGGSKQYVEITATSDANPVLLFIHGGPGWPQTPQLRYFNGDLTKAFIVATWDQRGCGKSFMNDSTAENISLEQIIADAHQLTQYLKTTYKKKKIYLAGFSWGSVVGLTLAQKYPEDYFAYVGISQVINISKGMRLTQDWIQEQATKKYDSATLQTLSRLRHKDTSLCKGGLACFMTQYELLTKYHGAVFNPASDKEVEKAMTQYDDYKNYDWNKGFFYSATRLEKDMFAADFSELTTLSIPAYFIEGRQDWNVPAVLVDEFVAKLKAPKKKIIWFEQSGHGPLEEEPARFNKTVISLLKEKQRQNNN